MAYPLFDTIGPESSTCAARPPIRLRHSARTFASMAPFALRHALALPLEEWRYSRPPLRVGIGYRSGTLARQWAPRKQAPRRSPPPPHSRLHGVKTQIPCHRHFPLIARLNGSAPESNVIPELADPQNHPHRNQPLRRLRLTPPPRRAKQPPTAAATGACKASGARGLTTR